MAATYATGVPENVNAGATTPVGCVDFLPRDPVLALVQATVLCLSVYPCPSVTSRSSVEADKQ